MRTNELEIVLIPTNEVIPYWRNPRRNDKTVEALCETIPVHGFNVPIVVDKNNVVVKGHARLKAAKRLGMMEVPCIVTDAPEDVVKADRIADNKIQELSAWDFGKLNFELEKTETPVFNKLFRPEEAAVHEVEFEHEAGFTPVAIGEYDFGGYQPPTAAHSPATPPVSGGGETTYEAPVVAQEATGGAQVETYEPRQGEVHEPRQCKTLCPYCGKVVYITV